MYCHRLGKEGTAQPASAQPLLDGEVEGMRWCSAEELAGLVPEVAGWARMWQRYGHSPRPPRVTRNERRGT